MLHLIPAPLHRAGLRLAHAVRQKWWAWRKPELEACAVVPSDAEGRVLLIRLSYGKGTWSFPTGGVGRRETPEQAARRELREETGCEAGALVLLGVLEDRIHGARHRVHLFAASVTGPPRPDGREVIEARLFPADALPQPLTASTQRRLDLWQASQQR